MKFPLFFIAFILTYANAFASYSKIWNFESDGVASISSAKKYVLVLEEKKAIAVEASTGREVFNLSVLKNGETWVGDQARSWSAQDEYLSLVSCARKVDSLNVCRIHVFDLEKGKKIFSAPLPHAGIESLVLSAWNPIEAKTTVEYTVKDSSDQSLTSHVTVYGLNAMAIDLELSTCVYNDICHAGQNLWDASGHFLAGISNQRPVVYDVVGQKVLDVPTMNSGTATTAYFLPNTSIVLVLTNQVNAIVVESFDVVSKKSMGPWSLPTMLAGFSPEGSKVFFKANAQEKSFGYVFDFVTGTYLNELTLSLQACGQEHFQVKWFNNNSLQLSCDQTNPGVFYWLNINEKNQFSYEFENSDMEAAKFQDLAEGYGILESDYWQTEQVYDAKSVVYNYQTDETIGQLDIKLNGSHLEYYVIDSSNQTVLFSNILNFGTFPSFLLEWNYLNQEIVDTKIRFNGFVGAISPQSIVIYNKNQIELWKKN